MSHYSIAGLPFDINNVNDRIIKHSFDELDEFRSDSVDVSSFHVDLAPSQSIIYPHADICIGDECFSSGTDKTITTWSKNGNTICGFNVNQSRALLHYPADELRCDIKQQLSLVFSSFLANRSGFFMHGAILKHREQGIIFSAASGGGKSTQANHWVDCFRDEIINGDKSLIRIVNGQTYAYGSPWSGSSYIIKNQSVPLKAIVLVAKASENRIERMTDSAHILSVIAPNVYYPYWDEDLVDKVMDTIDQLISKVSFWILYCRNEKESAIIAEQSIFSEASNDPA